MTSIFLPNCKVKIDIFKISTKTALINFAIKEEGLLAQLLGLVVKKEKPQLEEMKSKLVTTISEGKKTLQSLEDELLRLLYESRGSLLENKELFDTLQISKVTSHSVKVSLEVIINFNFKFKNFFKV